MLFETPTDFCHSRDELIKMVETVVDELPEDDST